MAFNPSPKVADARDIARKHGKTRVILLMIDDVSGTMEYASYGATPELCTETRHLADVAYDAVYDALACAPETQPKP